MIEGEPLSSEEWHIIDLNNERKSILKRLSSIKSVVSEWEREARSKDENMPRPKQRLYKIDKIQEMRFEIGELEKRIEEIDAELKSLNSQ